MKSYVRWLAEAVYGVRTGVQVSFRFALDDHVSWVGRPGTYRIAWRRYHENHAGTHVLYGLCKVGEEQVPAAHIYTALEPDLQEAA